MEYPSLLTREHIFPFLTESKPTMLSGKQQFKALNYGDQSKLYYGLQNNQVIIFRATEGNSFVYSAKKTIDPKNSMFLRADPKVLFYGHLQIHPEPPLRLTALSMDEIIEEFERNGYRFEGRPSSQIKRT